MRTWPCGSSLTSRVTLTTSERDRHGQHARGWAASGCFGYGNGEVTSAATPLSQLRDAGDEPPGLLGCFLLGEVTGAGDDAWFE